MGRYFRRGPIKNKLIAAGKVDSITVARYAGAESWPKIIAKLEIWGRNGGRVQSKKDRDFVDIVEVEMNVEEAIKLTNQLIAVIDAALPEKPRGRVRGIYGE